MRSSRCFRQIPALLLLASVAIVGSPRPADAQNTADAVRLTLRWHDTKPDNSLTNVVIFLGFHNGQFDGFSYGDPVNGFVADWMARAFVPAPEMVDAFEAAYPGAKAAWIWNPYSADIAYPGPPPPARTVTVTLDPSRHRFASYLFPLNPSNDALAGNEDPFQIELFDDNGKFKGPMFVDVFGNSVVDAGICANDEARLFGLDVFQPEDQTCAAGEGTVRIHPGLNGSARNPDAAPKRVLGGQTSYYEPGHSSFRRYGELDADFSRPGYKLGRLVITRWAATGNRSGSWYSPDHAGEGFSIEVLEPEEGSQRARMLVYWYTFAPDGSGEQVWLMGLGEFDADEGVAADVQMYRTVGGRFASPQNPDLVERQPWGRVRIGFGRCNEGRVFWYPDDPAWPGGDYFIYRLSPEIEGLGWTCRPEDAELVLPGD